MRVRVEASCTYGADNLIKEYPWLKKYNFEDPDKDKKTIWGNQLRNVYITVESLEDLLNIVHKSEQPIILSYDRIPRTYIYEWVLEIYDGYRE